MQHLYVAVSIAALTLLSYFFFPGHTFLQSDTQIYIPILERFWDPSVLESDIVATRPHVAFTIYDEVSIALRRITGMEFQGVLTLQQLVFRALGILGVYLIATASALSRPTALLVAAMYTLGATIVGPAVLTVEYEPVPRGFTVPMILLAAGLCAHGRIMAGAAAGAIATMYHPPTVYPFALVFLPYAAWRREWRPILVFLSGALILLLASRVQMGLVEPQWFFTRLDPELEKLQRMRASYNWVGGWIGRFFWHYFILFAAVLLAYWRVRRYVSADLKPFVFGLPVVGALSVPVSFVLLDRTKWSLIAQVQPARALLFITAMAVILGAIAAVHAARKQRWIESAVWFVVVFAVPSQTLYLNVLWPDLSNPVVRIRASVVLGLALLTVTALWVHSRRPPWSRLALALAVVSPFFALPYLAKTQNYPALHHPEIDALAAWARSSTPKDAVFLFADSGQNLAPGVFRARALRSLYVDWKGGGQVNFLRSFARDWWSRWQSVMAGKFEATEVRRFKEVGIDFLVLTPKNRLPDRQPVYENSRFLVYRISSREFNASSVDFQPLDETALTFGLPGG